MSTKPTMTEQDDMALIIHGVLIAAQGLEPGGRVFIAHAAAQNLIAAGFGDVAAAKAEALREAADELGGLGDTAPPKAHVEVADWLRDRANHIEEQTNDH